MPALKNARHERRRPSGCYVYVLVDPRDGAPFYVGKGTGDRMYAHEREARRLVVNNSAKALRIRQILDAGFTVEARVIVEGLTSAQAYRHERALIAQLRHEKLTNVLHGSVSVEENLLNHARIGIGLCRRTLSEAGHPSEWIEATRSYLAALLNIEATLLPTLGSSNATPVQV